MQKVLYALSLRFGLRLREYELVKVMIFWRGKALYLYSTVNSYLESLRFRPQTLIQKRRFPKEEPMSSGAINDEQSIFGMLISLLSFTHHPRASPLSSPSPLPTSSFL